jgi:biofilm protein TabA
MIFDSLAHHPLYHCLHPHFATAFAFIGSAAEYAPGHYPLGDSGSFAIISEYMSKPETEGFIECHHDYIDIQSVLRGSERCGVIHKQRCLEQTYDAPTDLQKLHGIPDWITLLPGHFAIFFSHDGHMPAIINNDETVAVKKIVVKVRAKVAA